MAGLSVSVSMASGEQKLVQTTLDTKTALVRHLATEVAYAFGVPATDVRLLDKLTLLEPEAPLKDAGVQNGARLQLVVNRSRLALTCSRDGTAKLWELESGHCMSTMDGHGAPVEFACFSPDGALALTTSGQSMRLFDVNTNKCQRLITVHSQCVRMAVFSPSGSELLSGSDDGTAKLVSVDTGACLQTLSGHTNAVLGVACSPDGRKAATASKDGTVRLWSLATGECLHVVKAPGYTAGGTGCPPTFSADGSAALFMTTSHEASLYDVESGEVLQVFRAPYQGIIPEQYDMDKFSSIGLSPNQRLVLTVSYSGEIRIWSRRSGEAVQYIRGPPCKWAMFSEDSSRVLTTGHPCRRTMLWDVASGQNVQVLEGHEEGVNSAVFLYSAQLKESSMRVRGTRSW